MKITSLPSSPRLAVILSMAVIPCILAQDNFLQNIYEDQDYRQRSLFEGLTSDDADADEKGGEGEKFTDLIHFSLAGGFRYNDNIFLSKSDKEDDVILTISPTLSIVSGREGTAQNTYSFSYTPSFLFYMDHSSEDTVDHRASFRFTKKMPKSDIAFNLDFTDSQGSDRQVSGSVSRSRLNGALHYNYQMTGKTRLDLLATTDLNNFKTAGNNDQNNYGLRTSVLYQWTGKLAMGPSFSYRNTSVDVGHDQNSYDFGVKADYIATGKTSITGTVGYNVRTFDGSGAASNDSTMDWSIGARYAATGKTSLRATFYREPEVSYNFTSSGYMATGISLSASHAYSQRVNFFGLISYENDDYYSTGTGGSSHESDYATATVGGNYRMQNGVTVGANMTYRTKSSDFGYEEFDNFTCGINTSYNFW